MQSLLDQHEIPEGGTRNVHHCKQGHGNDRMYITDKPDCYLFYCHHCGSKGRWKKVRSKVKQHLTPSKKISHSSYTGLPEDCVWNTSEWPVKALAWLLKAKLTVPEIKKAAIAYSPSMDRVVIPVAFNKKIQGYTARALDGQTPKYLAACYDKDEFLFVKDKLETEHVVIVEDILSCIRISKQCDAVALQGTTINLGMMNHLISNYKSFIIWLDNDNPQVKLNQVKAARQLSPFGPIYIVKSGCDPKELTDKEIEETLNGHLS